MRNRKAEQREAREESIRRLVECVARHEARGDLVQAALFAELLVEAQDRLALADVSGERNAPSRSLVDHPPHHRILARYHNARTKRSHIVVGDHTPEPRVTDEMRAGLGWK